MWMMAICMANESPVAYTKLLLFKVGVFTNKKILLATGLSFAMQIAIIHIPYCERIFKVTPLGLNDWATVFGFSFLIFLIMEIIKWLVGVNSKSGKNERYGSKPKERR